MKAIEALTSVLCDPEGKCCISGSDDDRRLIDSALVYLAQAAQPAPVGAAPECLTCSDHGAVGNILTAEPCPDCTRLNTQTADSVQEDAAGLA